MALKEDLLLVIKASTDKLKSGMQKFGSVAKAIFADVSVAIGYMVKQVREGEKANARLNGALKSIGITSKAMKKEMKSFADELATKTAFDDEKIKDAMSTLLNSTGSVAAAMQGAAAAAGLARAQDMDLEAAALLVGKAYNGNSAALKRYGIALRDGVSGTEALNAIQRRFAESTSEYVDNAVGKTEILMNQLNDDIENMSRDLLPLYTDTIHDIGISVKWLSNLYDLATKGQRKLWGGYEDLSDYSRGVQDISDSIKDQERLVRSAQKELDSYKKKISFGAYMDDSGQIDMGKLKKENKQAFLNLTQKKILVDQQVSSLVSMQEKLKNQINKENAIEAEKQAKDKAILLAQEKMAAERSALIAKAQSEGGLIQTDIGAKASDSTWLTENDKLAIKTEIADKIKALNQAEYDNQQEHLDKLAVLHEEYNQKLLDLDAQRRDTAVGGMSQMFGDLASLTESGNRNLFEIGKAAAIAQIAVDTTLSASKVFAALAAFPPLAIGAAAAAVVAGGVRAAQVSGIQFNPQGAADGVFDFRGNSNHERLVTTLGVGESIVPKTMTDAIKNGDASFGGGAININVKEVYGVPKKEFVKGLAKEVRSQIQTRSGIKASDFTGATS